MKIILTITILFITTLNLAAQSHTAFAKEAKDLLEQKDYFGASSNAIKSLRLQPKNKSAQETLSISFSPAVASIKNKIEELQKESQTFEGDKTVFKRTEIYNYYVKIRELDNGYKEISKTVDSKKFDLEFDKLNYRDDMYAATELLDQAKLEAAEMHYLDALILSATEDRRENKKAALEFKKVLMFVPDYKDAKVQYEKTREKGTATLLVYGLTNYSNLANFANIESEVAQNFLLEMKNNFLLLEFTKLININTVEYNAKLNGIEMQNMSVEFIEANASKLGVDVVISGNITDINKVEFPIVQKGPYGYKKNVDSGQDRKYQDSNGKWQSESIWIDVTAAVTTYEKKAEAKASLSFSFKDLDYDITQRFSVFGESDSYNLWMTYTGDKRALNLRDFKGYDNGELPYPDDKGWVVSLSKELAKNMISKIEYLLK